MAVIKFTNSKTDIKRILDYVTKESKTTTNLVTGKDCISNTAYEEMSAIKDLFHKTDGRQYIHIVQSFAPTDKITKEQAHEIGLSLAEHFTGFQVLVATHIDREHLHNHLILNSVNFENGRKFNQSKQQMQEVKDYSDKLCLEYGLSVITKKEYKGIYKQSEYQVAVKGESWKLQLINDIDYAMKYATDKESFIAYMKDLGYGVTWTDTRKNITYTTPSGMKCRDNKLYDKKYLKGEMENAFNRRIKENKSGTITKGTTDTNTITNRNEIQFSTGRTAISNTGLAKTNITEYNGYKSEVERSHDISRNGNRTRKRTNTNNRPSFEGEDTTTRYEPIATEKGEVEISNQDNRYIFRDSNNNLPNLILAAKMIDNFFQLLSPIEDNAPKRKIKGFRRDLSPQAKREWYYKHRFSSSCWGDDEWEM